MSKHLVNRRLQRCSNATVSRFKTFKVKCACEMSALLDHLLPILGTTASPELTTVEINSASVISFLVPVYPSIFRSVKVGCTIQSAFSLTYINCKHLPPLISPFPSMRMTLTYHLSTPSVISVSIQWMRGRALSFLGSCTIRFPLHRHIPHIFSTTFPNWRHLTFQGYPLDILDGVSAHRLTHLSVTCPGS